MKKKTAGSRKKRTMQYFSRTGKNQRSRAAQSRLSGRTGTGTLLALGRRRHDAFDPQISHKVAVVRGVVEGVAPEDVHARALALADLDGLGGGRVGERGVHGVTVSECILERGKQVGLGGLGLLDVGGSALSFRRAAVEILLLRQMA